MKDALQSDVFLTVVVIIMLLSFLAAGYFSIKSLTQKNS